MVEYLLSNWRLREDFGVVSCENHWKTRIRITFLFKNVSSYSILSFRK